MSEPESILCRTLGELVQKVRAATKATGLTVMSADRIEAKQLGYRLNGGSHEGIRHWYLPVSSLLSRPLGVDPVVADALSDLLFTRTTRGIFAEWLSHRITAEEAAARARAHMESVLNSGGGI